MKLGLKDTQQRELVHVTLHCCLQVSYIKSRDEGSGEPSLFLNYKTPHSNLIFATENHFSLQTNCPYLSVASSATE